VYHFINRRGKTDKQTHKNIHRNTHPHTITAQNANRLNRWTDAPEQTSELTLKTSLTS
jgi:hypothetical protein